MRFIENTKNTNTRGECNGTRSIALLGNGIFYSISRDHKQPIKRLEFNKVLYNNFWSTWPARVDLNSSCFLIGFLNLEMISNVRWQQFLASCSFLFHFDFRRRFILFCINKCTTENG
jgi:hypothetical protein